ncbi:MAG: hypothetical protein QHI48_04705 [Bacteroidota bacterium]|nr:hypothetical protein [Bacteroidota bacterium]
MRHVIILSLACTAFLMTSCSDDTTVVTANAVPFLVDQQYYPTEEGTFWRYRVDTTGVTGPTVRDVSRKTSRMVGTIRIDSLVYAVQVNETVSGVTTTRDTVYIRKDAQGVHGSSPALRNFSGLGSILPNFPSFPKEYLLIPADISSRSSWDILRFEYNQIPLIPIRFIVTASYLGRETIQTDDRSFRECAKIRVSLDIRLPNLQNPQDILNPIVIQEDADFWFSRPLGLVVGDGAQTIFTLLEGGLPFTPARRRVHMEVIGYEIVQPTGRCLF